MKKFMATCFLLDQTFYKESDVDLTVAVAVKYLDKNGEEKVAVGWGADSYRAALHSLLSKINVSSIKDERVITTALCEVEEIS